MWVKINPKGLRWLIWGLFILLLITIGLAWGFYPEKYDFFREPVSSLGGLVSHDESTPNFPSYVIFSSGFVLMGVMAIIVSLVYFTNIKRFKFAILKGLLLFIMGLGAAFTAIPWDFKVILHGIGAFLFIASLAVINFVFQLLRYIKRHVPKPTDVKRAWDYYFDLTFVILLFAGGAFYFVVQGLVWVGASIIFISTAIAQKIVFFAALITIFLLDVDDIK